MKWTKLTQEREHRQKVPPKHWYILSGQGMPILMKALLNVGIAMQALHGQRDNKEEKSSIF
jgi:hypothetical protein